MKGILVTGASGFVGSELIAKALIEKNTVIAIARNNKEGKRVSLLVSKILEEKKLEPNQYLKNLIGLDFTGDWHVLKKISCEIKMVYHIAAHMSYSLAKFSEALKVNQKLSVELYEKINEYFPTAKYFVYVSTAYTCGNKPEKLIKEELHLKPHLVNSYQMTKWATEMSLAHLSSKQKVPLVIVRPSIIVGDRKTGRYSGKDYGLYMFIRYFLLAKFVRIKKLSLGLPSKNRINLVAIDDVVLLLLKLSKERFSKGYTLIHATCSEGTSFMNIALALKKAWGFELIYESPKTTMDKFVAKKTAPNQDFAQNGEWNFEMLQTEKILGYRPKAFSVNELSKLFKYYEENFSTHVKREFLLLGLKQVRKMLRAKK